MNNPTLKARLIQKHNTMGKVYEDPILNNQCAYEVAYFYEYQTLPDDAYVIERIESIAGQHIFIHNDKH